MWSPTYHSTSIQYWLGHLHHCLLLVWGRWPSFPSSRLTYWKIRPYPPPPVFVHALLVEQIDARTPETLPLHIGGSSLMPSTRSLRALVIVSLQQRLFEGFPWTMSLLATHLDCFYDYSYCCGSNVFVMFLLDMTCGFFKTQGVECGLDNIKELIFFGQKLCQFSLKLHKFSFFYLKWWQLTFVPFSCNIWYMKL